MLRTVEKVDKPWGYELIFAHTDRYAGKIAALRTHLAVKPMHTQLSFEEHKALRDVFADGTTEEVSRILEAHIGRTRETYSESVEDIAAADAIKDAG